MPQTKAREEGERSAGERLDHVIQETRQKVGRAVDTAREGVQRAVDEARGGVETVRDGFDALKDKRTVDLIDDTKALVREHPGASLMIGVGAGFVLGWLLRGRD